MLLCPLPLRFFRITQRFGENPEYYKRFGLRGHEGIDQSPLWPGRRGVKIYAPHDGLVTLKTTGPYGNHIELTSVPMGKENKQHKSILAHLESFIVKDFEFVEMGQVLGIMGRTGNATGIHLHYSYKII